MAGRPRVSLPPGWQPEGAYCVRRGPFRIAVAYVGEAVRFVVTRDGESRAEYRDEIEAAVAAAEGWET